MRVNRFVFLNLSILSLGDHLSVTVSPQSPFSTGYVTLLVTTGSPPFRLMSFYSEGQVLVLLLLSINRIPEICLPGKSGTRRTISDIAHPILILTINIEFSFQYVRRNGLCLAGKMSCFH